MHFQSRLTVLAALVGASLVAQDKVQLTAPTSGKVSFMQKGRQEQNIDAGGQQVEMVQELIQLFTIEALGADEAGKRSYKVTIDRVYGKLDIPMMGPIEFDSTKKDGAEDEEEDDDGGFGGMGMPSGPALSKGLREIAGQSFTAEVDADGTVLGTKGFEEVRKKAKKAFGMGGQMMEGSVNDRALENLVRSAVGNLPKGEVAAGDSWETKQAAGSSMPMEQSLKFEVKSATADAAQIAVSGQMSAKEGEKGPMGEMEIEGGKIEGEVQISRKDGFVARSKTTATMTIVVDNPMAGEMAIEMKLINEVMRADAAPKAEEKAPAAEKAGN